ncbi:hypothetical protein GQ457_12G009810 [Hibiscus cannabinus]
MRCKILIGWSHEHLMGLSDIIFPRFGSWEANAACVEEFLRLMGGTAMPMIAEPEEISSMVTFLFLPAASYFTGQGFYKCNADDSS